MLTQGKALAGSPDISYTINSEDCITAVSDGWIDFAKANDGRLLLPPEILGTVLWDWIADAQTRHVYRTLLQRARASATVVRFRIRCDSPTERRLLQMEIIPEAEGEVTFRTEVISSHARGAVSLLDSRTVRSESLLKICGWCMRVQVGDSWTEIEDAISDLHLFEAPRLPNLTHGMCPACYDAMLASFEGPAAPIPLE
jgi:hypothetical protein